jgi:hypothetical protein
MNSGRELTDLERDLSIALSSLSFLAAIPGQSKELHFSGCGIRTLDHCTTPSRCNAGRKAILATQKILMERVDEDFAALVTDAPLETPKTERT